MRARPQAGAFVKTPQEEMLQRKETRYCLPSGILRTMEKAMIGYMILPKIRTSGLGSGKAALLDEVVGDDLGLIGKSGSEWITSRI